MVKLLGKPTAELSDACNSRAISPKIKHKIVTRMCGRWKLTGFGPFLDVLDMVFAEFERKHPKAYADMCHAGILCPRLVRGSASTPSNHSWGTAIDLGFGASVDPRGDGFTYAGLIDFYIIAKKYGLFWGAGFRIEDAMHFEAGEALIRKWAKEL